MIYTICLPFSSGFNPSVEYELSALMIGMLVAVGVISGFINTLAGGGSMLTLPALMLLGMPADIANGTNRVGVLMQSVTGARGFRNKGKLEESALVPVLVPTVIGAMAGSVLASYLPLWVLEPVLLVTMITMALIMLVQPEAVAPPESSRPFTVGERPVAAVGLFLAGVYGGFVQAGVGFILIAALAGGLRFDLVRANALKTVCTAVFAGTALIVFTLRSQVWWIPGLILAVGSVIGAMTSVHFAINVSQKTLKWILFVMVFLTCAGVVFFNLVVIP